VSRFSLSARNEAAVFVYDGPWLANGDLMGARGVKLDRWRCGGKRGEGQNGQK